MRDSDIAVGATRGIAVPSTHARHRAPHHRAPHRADPLGSEIGIELVPGVPHRRQAVAEVRSAAGTDDRFHGAVADRQDEVETVEVELLDRRRKQRQVRAIEALHERQMLHERRPRPHALDRRRHRSAHVDEGEQRSVRKALADGIEHFLAAAHPGQPVVHDRDALRRSAHGNTCP